MGMILYVCVLFCCLRSRDFFTWVSVRLISPIVEQVADREVGEIDIYICRYSCTLRSSLLVRLKPYISPDVAIDCPPSTQFLSICIKFHSLVFLPHSLNERIALNRTDEIRTPPCNGNPIL